MARNQVMKVYHGLPKSTTDRYTSFYESMEKMPEGFAQTSAGIPVFKYGVTGLYPTYANCSVPLKQDIDSTSPITIDLWVHEMAVANQIVIWLEDANGNRLGVQKAGTTGKLYFVAYINSTWKAEAIVASSITPTGTFHVRYVADIQNKIGRVYINGKLVGSTSLTNILSAFNNFTGKFNKILFNSAKFSDLHVSNIDRGDYFPNLPNDFIDGKAIVVPRMGQQQIKGDPMYSQVTTVKLKSALNGGQYDLTNVIDNLARSVDYPEVYTNALGNADSGTKIRIKGLNGEVISGVIDTDTALCKAIKALDVNHLVVDSVSRLTVGDNLRAVRIQDKVFTPNASSIYYQVTEIIPETSSIKLTQIGGAGSGWTQSAIDGGYTLAFELTESSSSPIVKTADGTTVVGSWSGLGTNEATFTLGTNSSIAGKDIYVQYALTMPNGNSDFPELPTSIEKVYGEDGREMKLVSDIQILDDFTGKTKGDTKVCPHKIYSTIHNSLRPPTDITGNYSTGYEEISTTEYLKFNKLDGVTKTVGASAGNSNMPQQLFEFDLIAMVETKIGVIPSYDKVQWLKDNISKFIIRYSGYGVCPSGNKYVIANYKGGSWITTGTYTYTSVTTQVCSYPSDIEPRVTADGKFLCLVYTDASSSSSTVSNIFSDYISLEIQLKTDSTYSCYYTDDITARGTKCCPILIQKETKTVKRYLPSKESFITECKYVDPKYTTGSITNSNILYKKDNALLTTLGTGSKADSSTGIIDMYEGCLGRLRFITNPYLFNNEKLYSSDYVRSGSVGVESSCYLVNTVNYPSNNLGTVPVSLMGLMNGFMLKPYLVVADGELWVEIYGREYQNGKLVKNHDYIYKLPNRPLIK